MHFPMALQSHLKAGIQIQTRALWLAVIWLLSIHGSGLTVSCRAQNSEAAAAQDLTVLELNKPIQRELSGGQKHSYGIAVTQGQYVRIQIKPQSIDLGALLQGSDGKIITRIGHPYTIDSERTIELVAESAGNLRLDIYTGAKTPAGTYVINIAELRPATETDRALQQARDLFNEYLRLNRENKYLEARSFLMRALEIRERLLGPEDLVVADTLDDLSANYALTGDYLNSVSLRERLLHIQEKILGPDHPDVGYTLHNLGIGYQDLGDAIKAEELHQRALGIYEKANRTNLTVTSILQSLGDIYFYRSDYQSAEKYYLRSRAILEKLLGPDHFHLSSSFSALGLVAYQAGDYPKAEAMFTRALALSEKAFGRERTQITGHLNNLAMLYSTTGEYVKAEALYRRVLAIHEQTATLGHVRAQEAMFDLARIYEAEGMVSEAVKSRARASEIEERYIELNLAIGSEREKLEFLSSLSDHASQNVSLHTRLAPNDPTALNLAVTTVLQRKGRVQDAMSAGLAALRRRLGPEDQKLLDQLNETTARLANLVLNAPARMPPAERQAKIDTLQSEREKLEEKITRRSAGFYGRPQPVTLAAVQGAVPDDAVLIEFVIYRPFNPKAPENQTAYGAPHYAAYVLRHSGAVSWKELGEATAIDRQVADLRGALLTPKSRNIKQLARAVDEKLGQPLRALIGDAKQLLVSPDGALSLLPFEALIDEKGDYLVRRFAISYLTSGRDLLRLQVARQSKSEPMVVANPTFGEPQTTEALNVAKESSQSHVRKRSVTTARDLSTVYFAALNGTAQEARAIKLLFPEAHVFTGAQATESALKKADAPSILHIATHGFFLTDAASLNDKVINTTNPLLRSGLALTGANLRTGGGEDGILTALEASGLNLWGTRLVTLSACNTGIGEVRTGEGVYGLRRALVLAGAETSVMSLWPVSDYVTRELMTAYYKGLKQGRGRTEALRQVQLDMLKRKEREHPFYWASFIQSGEWANLDGQR